MLKYALAFTTLGVVFFNIHLGVEKKAFLLVDKASADGWSHTCKYYKPVGTITVTRPIQFPCQRYDAL
jgi:hypothetical protein